MTVIYSTHLSNDTIFRCVFHFFKILIFWVHTGVKVQKMFQNDKKSCLLLSISQEPYIIWLSLMVQICKMICPGVFFNFKILIFQVVRGLKEQKNGPKWQKFLSVAPYISGTINDLHLWYIYVYKRIISPGIFFIFLKILIFGIIRGDGKRAKNGPKWQKILWFGYTCKMMTSTANFFIFQNFNFWGF